MAIIVSKHHDQAAATGQLSVVATPIGNLSDLSARARETLSACDLIAAEDTRRTAGLLRHLAIAKPMVSLHDHNERERVPALLAKIRDGAHVALVSDAGTPAINDPGYALVHAAAQEGMRIVAVPGACAAIAALSVAGLPTDRFCFEGFLPTAPASRRARLEALAEETRTLVFYEAPHRIADCLRDCVEAFGAGRAATVSRELTKIHESVYRGTLAQLLERSNTDPDFSRGEIVLILAGATVVQRDAVSAQLDRVLALLLPRMPLKQAAELAAEICGARANESYKRALSMKS